MPPKFKSKSKPPPNFTALRHYANLSHTHTSTHPSPHPPSSPAASPTDDLTPQIAALRRLIIDEELHISQLRSQLPDLPSTSSEASTTALAEYNLKKLVAQRKAHDLGFQGIDYIPPADSPLNTLLAYRSVTTVIARTAQSIKEVEAQAAVLEATQAAEEKELDEQRALTAALRARLAEVESEDVGSNLAGSVARLVKRRKEVARMTAGVLRELRWFVREGGLARMLVAEEMGGPVVGDVLEVETGTGFDKRGKARGGERRIDEMWGMGEGEEPEVAVGGEFMGVLEELMNASLENDPYIQIKKDTAIVRFLVRAKVAAFHPKDARRVRLMDFGSTVEDG